MIVRKFIYNLTAWLIALFILVIIPGTVANISIKIIRKSSNYWLLENGISLSKILGWIVEVTCVVLILTNKRLMRKN